MTKKPQRKPPAELVGKVVSGKYRLKKLVASDHVGVLYLAEEIKTRKQLAVKALAPGVRVGVWDATGIKHPNIVKVHQFLDLGGDFQFVVTDQPPGQSLTKLLKLRRKLKPGEAVSVVMQVLAGLHSLHGSDLVHGVVNPDTVFVARDAEEHLEVGLLFLGGVSGGEPPTMPFYLSPEQDLGEGDVDQRSDIWAVGVLLFEMVFGRRPFAGRNRDEISSKILLKPPVFPEGDSVPSDFTPIISKALQKEADDRYQNVTQMLGDLLPIHEELDEEFGRASEEAIRDSLVPPPIPEAAAGQKRQLGVFEAPFAEEGPPSVKPILFKAPPVEKQKAKPPQKPAAKPPRGRQATQELRVFAPPVPAPEPEPVANAAPPKPEATPKPKAEPKPAAKPAPKPKAVPKPKPAPTEPKPIAKPAPAKTKPKPKKGVEPKSKDPTIKAIPLSGGSTPLEEVEPGIDIDVAPPPLQFDSGAAGDGSLFEELELEDATTLSLKERPAGFGDWVSRNRKLVIIIGASVAAACLLIVLLIVLLSGGDEQDLGAGQPGEVAELGGARDVDTAQPPEASSEPKPEATPEPTTVAQTGAADDKGETGAVEPEAVTVALKGLPDGATITAGGRDVESSFSLDKSESPVAIAVRAEGFEPYNTQLVPNQDWEIVVSMDETTPAEGKPADPGPAAPAGGGGQAAGSKSGQASWGGASAPAAAPASEPEPEPEPETKPKKKKNVWATNPF